MFDDAFIIQRVPFKNVAYLAYVSGMVDVIRFFIRSRQQGIHVHLKIVHLI